MNKQCKRALGCCLLAINVIFCIGASSKQTQKGYSWYTVKVKDHMVPPPPAEFARMKTDGVIYLDEDAAKDGEKVIYLTFDAGYENGNVGKILDILKEEKAEAAFFVLSNLAQKNSSLLLRMKDEGHLVCNHTSLHKDMSRLTKEAFLAELGKLEEQVKLHAGCETAPFYRPPEGRYSQENLIWANEAGYTTVFWSLCYADWDNNRQPSEEQALSILCEHIHPGAIVLLHPTSATNAAVLRELIRRWRADGYEFARIDKIKP